MQRHKHALAAASLLLALAPAPLMAQAPVTRGELRGTWAHEIAACSDRQSDGRIAIREKTIRFFASDCTIRRVVVESKSGWAGAFRCQESGEFRNLTIELFTPGVDPDPNRLQLRIGKEEWRQLVRCPQNLPVR
jgi:hypothetical protein